MGNLDESYADDLLGHNSRTFYESETFFKNVVVGLTGGVELNAQSRGKRVTEEEVLVFCLCMRCGCSHSRFFGDERKERKT